MRLLRTSLVFGALSLACVPGGRLEVGTPELVGPVGSGEVHLASVGDSMALVTWIEDAGERGHALRVAIRSGGRWSAPRTIAEGASLLANWADFPSIVETSDGRWLAHWLEKTGDGHLYGIRLVTSSDLGETWSAPLIPHRAAVVAEHGFVSAVPWEGGAALIWLDGRAMVNQADSTRAMQLRFARLVGDTVGPESVLDARTCECCQTALARTAQGMIAAYRDRTEGEIRDIAVVRYVDGQWSEPRVAWADGWHFKGCPVNGPQLAASGDTVALAWFAAPNQQPRVQVAFSLDGGATFAEPVRVDDGKPMGRVDVELIDRGTAVVSWIENAGTDADVRSRFVSIGGKTGSSTVVSATSAARSSGFPRMTRVGNELLFAWTAPGDDGGVRVAVARVAR